MNARFLLPLLVSFLASYSAFADAPKVPETAIKEIPKLSQREDTSRFETTPWIKKIDISKSAGLLRIIVKASAATECYKQREIERIFEKNAVKIVLRLQRPKGATECSNTKIFDYEEKVFESSLEQAPAHVWILGHEGWHKLKVHEDGKVL